MLLSVGGPPRRAPGCASYHTEWPRRASGQRRKNGTLQPALESTRVRGHPVGLFHRGPITTMPTICNYYVTLRCNQRCLFCNIPHTNDGSASREPTMEQVRENLRDVKRLGAFILDVTGGEPLLYGNLVEMLALAKKMRFVTSVTTNGMLYPKYAERLVGKVDALLFSIDSTDRHEHDRIRATKSFHLALEALAVARKLRQPLYISHVVTNESFDHVDEMIRFAKDQGAILYLNPCFSFFGNEGLDREKARGLFKYFGKPSVIVDRAQLELIVGGGNDTGDPVCRAVSSTVVISPENQLLLPCYHFKDKALPIQGKLYDLYKYSDVVREAREGEGKYSFCQGCTVYCYMRSSLYWRYPVSSVLLYGHYFRERVRQRVRNIVAPPQPTLLPSSSSDRRRSSSVSVAPLSETAGAAPARRKLPLVGVGSVPIAAATDPRSVEAPAWKRSGAP
jgi:MoaA/NifB/PqqE/SkfB family radical SAM enzyme